MSEPSERTRSIAAIVLDGAAEARRARARARARLRASGAVAAEGVAGIALARDRGSRGGWAIAVAVALALHAAGGLWIAEIEVSRPPRAPTKVIALEREIEFVSAPLPRPEARPEPPPPEPIDEPPVAQTPPTATPTNAPRVARAAAPARAAKVATATPPPAGDAFAGFDMTQGDGQRYSGGVTARSGTGSEPGRPGAQPGGSGSATASTGGGAQASSRARSVRLRAQDWECPWPSQARDLTLARQVVMLRVLVRADGSVGTAEVLTDPGHGFGDAALACARTTKFQPALDGDGKAYAATSPPVRVTFERRGM